MTSVLSSSSQMMLRHADFFKDRHVLFAGDLQDTLPARWTAKSVRAHLTTYQRFQQLSDKMRENIEFSALPNPKLGENIDTLIYFWPKSKREAQFQLAYLRALVRDDADIFIVGENRSGVRSCEKIFAEDGLLKKIDTARHCSLYHFRANGQADFDINKWWEEYSLLNGTKIRTLPGVFSANHLDEGSLLLIEAFNKVPEIIHGDVLDIGAGAGVLAAYAATINPSIHLTLSDINAVALMCCEETLNCNDLNGKVIPSNVFSNISKQYDLIVSNPPFHDGMKTNYGMVETLIREAKHHLKPGGRFCMVANAFLPYPDLLDRFFGHYQLLSQTPRFKVYLAGKNE